jgi:hypothetical protein
MDLVRVQSERASAVVTAIVRMCNRVFALRRIGGELVIRRVR